MRSVPISTTPATTRKRPSHKRGLGAAAGSIRRKLGRAQVAHVPQSVAAGGGEERRWEGEHGDRQHGTEDEAANDQRAPSGWAAQVIAPVREGEVRRPAEVV